MADYSAVLRNALSKIDATDDALREGIYQKARDSIARKIEALPKQPPQAAIDAQFAKLDAAIAEVDAEFAPLADAEPALDVPTIDTPPDPEPVLEQEPETEPEPVDDEAYSAPSVDVDVPPVDDTVAVPDIDDAGAALESAAETVTEKASDPLLDFLDESNATEFTEPLDPVAPAADGDLAFSSDDAVERAIAAVPELADSVETPIEADAAPFDAAVEKSSPRWGLLGGIVLMVGVIGGLGYAAYTNQDQLRDLIGIPAVEDAGVPVRTVPSTVVEPDSVGTAETEQDTAQQVPVEAATGEDTAEKFTQRLTEDGTEVDEGPVGGNVELGEGSSVSAQSEGTAEPETDAAQEDVAQEADADGAAQEADVATPLPVGQRALFYEERTGSQAGTSFPGAAIWSVVQQEPAAGLAPEPAIRVEASVPDLGIVLEMIIKRNGDDTLPASHIAELFFRVPATFEGRGIADVQRLTLKEAESDPGNALIAVPAPIDTNIFLIALNNSDTAVTSNVALLKERDWLDIPMQYISGRRALITLEKGSGGRAVFDEVFAAWDANPL